MNTSAAVSRPRPFTPRNSARSVLVLLLAPLTFLVACTATTPPTESPSPMPPSVDGCQPRTVDEAGFPLPDLVGYANECNTGPRQECTTTVDGGLKSTHDGEVIENVCVNGRLEIGHNNVTVRDVLVRGTGRYALDIGQGMEVCPANVRIEYTEVDMSKAGDIDWAVYQRCAGGHVFDHVKVVNAGRGILTQGQLTIKDSYVYSNRTQPGAHRTAFSTHGGSGFTITGNTFICVDSGCSSALNLYSDSEPVTDALVQGNVFAGGSICLRGGRSHDHGDQTHDIRILDNRFSTVYEPECGKSRALGQFDKNAPGNVSSGNVWHENGRPIDGE